jgi:putative ABC transport system substrate-binding protein
MASAAGAQGLPRRVRLGILIETDASAQAARMNALREGLAQHGYQEPSTLELVPRYADGVLDRLPGLAAELVAMRVDVIVTLGTFSTRAAANATPAIPIVVAGAGDLVAAGLVANLARPGGNVTGITLLQPDLGAKQVDILQEIMPGISRIAVLAGPAGGTASLTATAMRTAGEARGIAVGIYAVATVAQIESAFSAMVADGCQAVIQVDGTFVRIQRPLIVELASRFRLPVVTTLRDLVAAGGMLFSYGASSIANHRRAAYYIDRILRGSAPAELPVEQPSTFELVVDLRTARRLGLTVPPGILVRADEVLE